MKIRISLALLAVVVLFAGTAAVAYADSETPEGRRRLAGEVVAVDEENGVFTLKEKSGEEVRVKVDDETRFRSPGGEIQGLGDLEAGMRALVFAVEGEDGGLLARVVIAAQAGAERPLYRAAGEIIGLDPQAGTIELEKRDGSKITVATGERTKYRSRDGQVQSFDDLKVGMVALLRVLEREDDLDLALLVAAAEKGDLPKVERYRGEIVEVTPGQGTFEIETQDGNQVSFVVTERTRFRSRDGSIEDIHDLKKGMKALVGAVEGEQGRLEARIVIAGDPAERPPRPALDVRLRGTVASVGASSITISAKDGSTVVMLVDENTRFLSRGKDVKSLADVETGMPVAAGGRTQESGEVLAVVLGFGVKRGERPAGRPPSPPVEIQPDPERPGH